MDSLDSIYIKRSADDAARLLALQEIQERQRQIEETSNYEPFLVFAEGGTTNGTGIMKFKKGAFYSEKKVKPIYLKYAQSGMSPAFDTMEFLPLVILTLSI